MGIKSLEDAGGVREYIGKFHVNDAPINMIVTDPCYDAGTWCAARLSVRPGFYDCFIEYVDFKPEHGGNRIVALEARHQDSSDVQPTLLAKDTVIGVDSGSCGIYDIAYYINNQKECKCGPYKYPGGYRLLGNGVTSGAGWGDGAYPLYLGYNSKSEIVSVRVEYSDLSEVE